MKIKNIEICQSWYPAVANVFHRNAELISFISAILLIILFGYAASSKVSSYREFVAQMELAPLKIMKSNAGILGWFIPLIEILIVMLLAKEGWRREGFFASLTLLAVFEIYIAAMLLSGMDLPCTCGGIISKLSWKDHLLFNGFFIVVAILPLISTTNKKEPDKI